MARYHVDGHEQQIVWLNHGDTCLQLLDKFGTRFLFGGTPEVGCHDSLFTLKALLNAQRNHNPPSFVGFVDLVKAYDTTNHNLLICIVLEWYGAPPTLVAVAVKMIDADDTVELKIKKKIEEIMQGVGVRQGNNMAPVLFLFLVNAFAETLEIK